MLGLELEGAVRSGGDNAEDGMGSPFREAPEVLAEDGRRCPGRAIEIADELAHERNRVLERRPRIELALRRAFRRHDMAGPDRKNWRPVRTATEPAGGRDRVDERETERRDHVRCTVLALDVREDRVQACELPRAVEGKELVDERTVQACGEREARAEAVPDRLGVRVAPR